LSGSLSGFIRVENDRLVDHDHKLEEEESDTNEAESEDLTSSESNVETSSNGGSGLRGDLGVGISGDSHTNVSAKHGGGSTNEEGHGGHGECNLVSSFVSFPRLVNSDGEDNSEEGAENGELGVFFFEEGSSTSFDMILDDDHLIVNFLTVARDSHEFLGFLLLGVSLFFDFC